MKTENMALVWILLGRNQLKRDIYEMWEVQLGLGSGDVFGRCDSGTMVTSREKLALSDTWGYNERDAAQGLHAMPTVGVRGQSYRPA